MMTEGYLLNRDSEENSSFVCMRPRISQTQISCSDYATSLTQQITSPKINAFSYSVLIDLKPKLIQAQTKIRKNAIDFAKKRRSKFFQPNQSNINKKTPFRNRKDLERKVVEQKLKQIRKKKDLAQILQGNVKRWLIIKEIPTTDKQKVRVRSQNSVEGVFDKDSPIELDSFNNECSQSKKKQTKMQMQKDKMNLYLKKSKKEKIYKKIQTTNCQFGKIADQLSKLRIQNNTSHGTIFIPYKNTKRASNLVYSRSSLSRQRPISLNTSHLKNFSTSPERCSTQDVQAIKKNVRESALKCKKIDIKDYKIPVRPQSAIFLQKIAKSKVLKAKQTVRVVSGAREMKGWQDLTDSYDRQIYF